MVAAWEWGAYLGTDSMEKGIRIRTSSYTRHHVNITMCKAKANGNYINSMLALQEALSCGYSDLVLSLSSHPESFGRTVVEALSMGVPVIGYDHGGVGEVLADAFPEGRVSTGDEEALLSKVRAFRSQPPRPTTPVPFTLEAMLAKTLSLYAELAAGGPPPYH